MGSPTPPPIPFGTVLDEVAFTVEAGKVLEFARATHATDPVHTDSAAGAAAGLPAQPATATHTVVAGHHRNPREFVRALGMDIAQVVVGSTEWEYLRPAVVGDELTGTRRVIDDVTKHGRRGGSMRLVTLETTWSDPSGKPVIIGREVLIERGA